MLGLLGLRIFEAPAPTSPTVAKNTATWSCTYAAKALIYAVGIGRLQISCGGGDGPDLVIYLSVTLGCPVPATSIRTVCFSRSSR
jgi:hypothetical protein